ncbi:galactitol-1-phosphate 5-dehydrogenase [Microbacterium sp. Bi121]|uniref:galactitol-1-phosphate 5-dehydrogenase n=1 Tax=Microbacterium sp. Bi121 TaxID=2822348 RepID=UPI001D9B4468|nr:galactitol-1-phosphate 5-dehydrogenase [Microbacterium sp. Bi121]CAH0154742.1 Galactitol-1-phosphate 5-dehydrogenase [Microbacterium sp. Bi121]
MKAAVLRGVRDIEITEVPQPEPVGVDSTLVRMDAVGVCGSDVLRFGVGKGYGFPLVLGHEMVATLVEDSPSGRHKAGARVALFPCIPRPEDPMTEIGEFALGTEYDYFGSRRDGGLQEYLRVPERNLFPLRDDMSLIEGALVEPAGVALHAVRKAPITPNASALVIGAGPIGLFAAQWLRVLGATRVIVADIDGHKRALADELGFETIDAGAGPSDQQVLEATGGRGVDIAVEASGLALTFLQAIGAAAHSGHVILLGDLSDDAVLSKEAVSRILRRELVLHGTWNAKITPHGHSEWDMVIAHLGRTVIGTDLVSHIVDMADAQSTFTALADRARWSNKTIFAVSDAARAEAAGVLAGSFSAGVTR